MLNTVTWLTPAGAADSIGQRHNLPQLPFGFRENERLREDGEAFPAAGR
jgi:hypothetical protein